MDAPSCRGRQRTPVPIFSQEDKIKRNIRRAGIPGVKLTWKLQVVSMHMHLTCH